MGSYADALEYIGSSRDSFYLEKLRRGNFAPFTVTGRNTQDLSEARRVFQHDFNASDIPEHSVVDWEVELATPSQLMQALSIARQAYPQGDILDLDTVLERVLKVKDPAAVKEGIQLRETEQNPVVQTVQNIIDIEKYASDLRRQAAGHRRAGNREDAAALNRASGTLEAILEQMTQGAANQALGNAGMGGGIPAQPGMNPQQFGTAAQARMNPQQLAAGQPQLPQGIGG